jgi:predicted Zn-dependent peptidase
MKKLSTFTDSLTKIEHTIYELDNGIKVFYANNPSSIEYVLTVAIRAGSSFENMNDVPHGTAHFLEHILSGNPNKYFKSKFEIDEFESGTREDPEINSNASTSKKYMYFYAFGNEEGADRINKRVKSVIDYPEENIKEYIEKERSIILAEQSHMNKKEFDKYLQFSKFLYKGEENGFTHTIIGERDDIENISVKNVIKFYRNQFVPENVLISIQSGRELLPSEIEEIEEIGSIFGEKSSERKYPNSKVNQKKRIHHFKDNQIEGVSLAILFPQEYQKSLDYNSEALEYLFRSLMRKISHDYLREKLGLIYSSQISSNFSLSFKERIIGYELVMQPENFKDVLKYLDKMIGSKIEKFLESKEGRVWFESAISAYIFPRNIPYKSNYAERKGLALLEDGEVLELDKAVNAALKIDIKDVQKFSKDFFNNPAIFWIESDSEGNKYIETLKESKLYDSLPTTTTRTTTSTSR